MTANLKIGTIPSKDVPAVILLEKKCNITAEMPDYTINVFKESVMVRSVTIKFQIMIKSEVDLNSSSIIYHLETLYNSLIKKGVCLHCSSRTKGNN